MTNIPLYLPHHQNHPFFTTRKYLTFILPGEFTLTSYIPLHLQRKPCDALRRTQRGLGSDRNSARQSELVLHLQRDLSAYLRAKALSYHLYSQLSRDTQSEREPTATGRKCQGRLATAAAAVVVSSSISHARARAKERERE